MKYPFIIKYWIEIVFFVLVIFLATLYIWMRWGGYLRLSGDEKKFVKAALSGIENVEFDSMRREDEKNQCYFEFRSWNHDGKIETYNIIRENMNQYLRSHPEWSLADYNLWICISKKGSQISVVHFYNYDDNPNNPEKWDALLYVRGDRVAMKTTAESILCLSDCKKLELKSSLEDWNILKHFKDLEYLIVDGLTEEEKEQIKKILPNCQVWAG